MFRGRTGFEIAKRLCNVSIEAIDQDIDVPQLDLAHLGTFDIVLFLGVFYHLLDPLAALREISRLAREVLVVETHVEETADPRPTMIFYPGDDLNGDLSNWWGPNWRCVEDLLRLNGFGRIDIRGRVIVNTRNISCIPELTRPCPRSSLVGIASEMQRGIGAPWGGPLSVYLKRRFPAGKRAPPRTDTPRTARRYPESTPATRSFGNASHAAYSLPCSVPKHSSSTAAHAIRSTRKCRKSLRSSHHAAINVTST